MGPTFGQSIIGCPKCMYEERDKLKAEVEDVKASREMCHAEKVEVETLLMKANAEVKHLRAGIKECLESGDCIHGETGPCNLPEEEHLPAGNYAKGYKALENPRPMVVGDLVGYEEPFSSMCPICWLLVCRCPK